MIWEACFSPESGKGIVASLVEAWADSSKKVFVLRSQDEIGDVREYYSELLPAIGSPAALAEDVTVGDRDNQRSGRVWMEVRFDPHFPDAYRHSSNAQPLHTDGSYIPTFPNASFLCCVSNADAGGETTFLDGTDMIKCLSAEAPTLLHSLLSVPVDHSRSGDRRNGCILREIDGCCRIYWNYFCVAEDFHLYLESSRMIKERTVAVKLGPGDAVAWKDDEILHGRNAFMATQEASRFIWKCAIDVGRQQAS